MYIWLLKTLKLNQIEAFFLFKKKLKKDKERDKEKWRVRDWKNYNIF